MATFSDRLREARAALGLTQSEFGEIGGVQKGAQIKYEAGDRSPDALYLANIAKAGVDVHYLVTGSREYEPPPPLSLEEQALIYAYRRAPAVGREFIRRCAGVPLEITGDADTGDHSWQEFFKQGFTELAGRVAAKGGNLEEDMRHATVRQVKRAPKK